MVGWHHRVNGHEFEQALGDGEGPESLACCSPWGHKESDMTSRLKNHRAGKEVISLQLKQKYKMQKKRDLTFILGLILSYF